MTNKYTIYLKEVKDNLDKVSNSFCLAKWLQVTLHLHTGLNHSCHHVQAHKIDLNELKNDVSALHNTNYKKSQRKLMLDGVRPKECEYCWKIEDNTNNYSDRVFKSAADYSYKHYDIISQSHWNDNVDPSYLEVSFSNVCNFKCSYCGPTFSSQWLDEIETMGQYPIANYKHIYDIIPSKDNNPYIEAFWKWFPDIYLNLNTLRVTGGEPLLSKDTFKLLDFIAENPNPNLNFCVNTNLNPPKIIFDKFIDKIYNLITNNKIRTFKIFTSAEGAGPALEYSRYGMDYKIWLSNLYQCYESLPNFSATIMSTYNIFSVTTYNEFLYDVIKLNEKFISDKLPRPLLLDIPYLRYPDFLSVFVLDDQDLHLVKNNVEYMQKLSTNTSKYHFHSLELEKLERIYSMLQNRNKVDNKSHQKNFISFVNEYDKRRGTNFLTTFPDLNDLYHKWAKL